MSYEEDDNERYGRARRMLPGLLGSGQKREKYLAAVTACSLLFTGFMWLRTESQLAAAKTEKQQGWVVVLDAKGKAVDLPIASASEWQPPDGLILNRLEEVIRCMHGLDPVPKAVFDCWEREKELFFGDAAVQFEAFAKERFPKVDDLLRAQQSGFTTVDIESWSKPEKALKTRFWLRWKRVFKPRGGGTSTTEMWSGTFDVELMPVTPVATSGMRIVRWEWHRDLSGSSKGVSG